MANKYKLTARLRQYTPLIHFQGDTEGACLRPSEVKPKLDRFVQDYLKRQGVEVPEAWKLKVSDDEKENRNPALRYKMRLEGIGKKTTQANYMAKEKRNEIHSLYFASMGDENSGVWDENGVSKTKSVFYEDGVKVTILCPQFPELLEWTRKLLSAFFCLHCFGNRSNKGFGSFTVCEINGQRIREREPKELLPYLPESCKALYYADYEGEELTANQRLDDIQAISAIMKGGMNYSTYDRDGEVDEPYYYKGAIFRYFMDDQKTGAHSEKALIKRDVLPNAEEDQLVQERYGKRPLTKADSCLYMRGVLGVGQTIEFRRNNKNAVSRRKGNVTIEGKERNPDDRKKPLIARFENPVHFKPYGTWLLLIPQEIPAKILGAEFLFTAKGKSATAAIPKEFDLDDFLMFFADEYVNSADLDDFYLDPRDRATRPVKVISALLHRVKEFYRIERGSTR